MLSNWKYWPLITRCLERIYLSYLHRKHVNINHEMHFLGQNKSLDWFYSDFVGSGLLWSGLVWSCWIWSSQEKGLCDKKQVISFRCFFCCCIPSTTQYRSIELNTKSTRKCTRKKCAIKFQYWMHSDTVGPLANGISLSIYSNTQSERCWLAFGVPFDSNVSV